jgi:uncharacterized phage-associated protein
MAVLTANTVANWFIGLSHEVGDPVSNLKLQKLVYYAQAWYVAQTGERLIPEPFEAWLHGPVCPPLYHRYKGFRWNPIDEPAENYPVVLAVDEHLREVMEVYGGLSAWDLERLTHSETPWLEARKGVAPDANCTNEISVESMRAFYAPLLNG